MSDVVGEYAAIMPCGGAGSRLAILTEGLPKPLFPVGGKELIAYSVEAMDPNYIGHLVFALGHGSDQLVDWVEGAGLQQEVDFSTQAEPGVLGAIIAGLECTSEAAFVACNTDEIRHGFDLTAAIGFHESTDGLATMVSTRADNLYRHRLIEVDDNARVTKTALKPTIYQDDTLTTGLINTGFLIIEKRAVDLFDPSHSTDWSGIIDPLCDAGLLRAYVDENIRFFNVGTLDEYNEAEAFLNTGLKEYA